MLSLDAQLVHAVQTALKATFGVETPLTAIQLQPTRKGFKGSHTVVTFPFAKLTQAKPPVIAEKLGAHLQENTDLVVAYEVVQGFLNLTLSPTHWQQVLGDLLAEKHLAALTQQPETVVLEFPSPNTNKPLHVGHLRNLCLGDATKRMLQAAGHQAHAVNLVNDRGIHICKSMVAYLRQGEGETPESTGMKGDHLVGKYYVIFNDLYKAEVAELTKKLGDEEQARAQAPILEEARVMLRQWEAHDADVHALWQKMNGWVYAGFDDTFSSLGITIDKTYYESETYLLGKDLVQKGLEMGVFYQKEDGSVWADLTGQGLDHKLLLRSDGTAVYMTQDLGTADLRHQDFQFDRSVYVVGSEQDYHFDVLFKLLAKLGFSYAPQLYHLSYGMVELPEGKMKSREGTVVDADQLIEEMRATAQVQTEASGKIADFSPEEAQQLYQDLAMGALKFFLLKVTPKKRMLFDPKASIDFQGDTGVFVQYTHARIATLLQKAAKKGHTPTLPQALPVLDEAEMSLLLHLYRWPSALQEAVDTYCPAVVAQYVLELAKRYNHLYAHHPMLREADADKRNARLCLSKATATTLRHALGLLGIQAPQRM